MFASFRRAWQQGAGRSTRVRVAVVGGVALPAVALYPRTDTTSRSNRAPGDAPARLPPGSARAPSPLTASGVSGVWSLLGLRCGPLAAQLASLQSRPPSDDSWIGWAVSQVSEQQTARAPPSRPPPSPRQPYGDGARQLINGMLAANVAVFLSWKVPAPGFSRFMHRWFLTGAESLSHGARGLITTFTATYSHVSFFHLLFNMMALSSFSPHLMRGHSVPSAPKMSPLEFFTFYSVTGMLSGLGSNAFHRWCRVWTPSVGASGSLFAVMTYFVLSHPESQLLVFGILPVTAMTGLLVGTGVNAGLAVRTYQSMRMPGVRAPTLDGMAHLVGTGLGAAYFYYKRRQELLARMM